MIKQVVWEVSQGYENEIVADMISLCLNHEDWDEDKTMLVLLSIDKWYRKLPLELKNIVDAGTLKEYEVVIKEVAGLPI